MNTKDIYYKNIQIGDVKQMTDKEIEECFHNCIEYSNKIKNPILRKCCQEIYSDYKEQLINKPAYKR